MKIFYAVQATGNGHIARAMELVPHLQQYGEVDIFLSGSNCSLDTSDELPVKYRSKGISLFYGTKGSLDYWKMFKQCSPLQAYKEAKNLPVEKYDIVINDFESITSMACRMKNISSVNFGHQASFISDKVPRPTKRSFIGEMILKKYAMAQSHIGLHFEQYDDFIFPPVIKKNILDARVDDLGHVTVYLPHYSDLVIMKSLKKVREIKFEVFSKRVQKKEVNKNITFIPIGSSAFNESMINAKGIITGAGFETPAEALYLGKKLMALPIKGQYEQLCNAAALKRFNVPVLENIDEGFTIHIREWLENNEPEKLKLPFSTEYIVSKVIHTALSAKERNSFQLKSPVINPSLSY